MERGLSRADSQLCIESQAAFVLVWQLLAPASSSKSRGEELANQQQHQAAAALLYTATAFGLEGVQGCIAESVII